MCWSLEQWRRCVGLRGCVCGCGGCVPDNCNGRCRIEDYFETIRLIREERRKQEEMKQCVNNMLRRKQQQDTSDSSEMQVIVSGLSGGSVTVDVPQDGSVSDLMYEIFHKTGVNPSAQMLKRFNVLDVDLPLSLFDINEGSSIVLTSRCLGSGDFDIGELPKMPFQETTNMDITEENDSKMPALPDSEMPAYVTTEVISG